MGKDNSHSHSFSNSDDERRRKLLRLSSQRDVNKLQKSFNYTRRQSDPREIERVKAMFYGNEPTPTPKRTKWGDHYKHNPIDHDLESTIDQIRNSTGKYKHTKHKAKKLDQDYYEPTTILDRENNGKLNKGSGIPIGLIMGLLFVGIMLIIALPIFDSVTTEMQMGNQNTTSVDSNLAGFPSFVQDNLMIWVVIVPIALVVLIVARMF